MLHVGLVRRAFADDHQARHRASRTVPASSPHSKTLARAKKGDVRQCVVAMDTGDAIHVATGSFDSRAHLTCRAHPEPADGPETGKG